MKSCYDRYREKYPDATIEDFKKAQEAFRRTHAIAGPPQGVGLPNGVFISANNISPSDVAIIAVEHVRSASV